MENNNRKTLFLKSNILEKNIEDNKFNSRHDAIYYNLTLNNGYTQGSDNTFTTSASINETNNTPFLLNSEKYWIAINRATIPTGGIPRYIFPIKQNQSDINLAYNCFTFRYCTGLDINNNPIYIDTTLLSQQQKNVSFVSEIINPFPYAIGTYIPTNKLSNLPKPPTSNNGLQDVSGSYYFIYNVESLVSMFNNTISLLWTTYISAMQSQYSITLSSTDFPFYVYDNDTQLWSFYAPSSVFSQNVYPRVEMFVDELTESNTLCPGSFFAPSTSLTYNNGKYINAQIRLNVLNRYVNLITLNSVKYYAMYGDKSPVSGYSALQKIIIEVTGDIILVNNELDSAPLNFQEATTSIYQKPLLTMLTDLEVNKEEFAQNPAFIQFQASSIEQVRLISLAQKSSLQNFTISVNWLDNFGNKRLLEIPSIGNPLTIKLAFYNKHFKN